MKNRAKLSILALALLFAFPTPSHADVGTPFNSWNNANTYILFNSPNFLIVYQTLGQLTGTVNSVAAVPYFSAAGGSVDWSAQIQCFTDAAYTIGCTNSAVGTTSIASANVGQWATTTISSYTLTAPNYYRLRLAMASRVSGTYTSSFANFVSPTDAYPAGAGNANGFSTQGGTLTDYVFNVSGAGGYFDSTTHVESITPADGSTIATSSAATFAATGYINPADYQSGMYIQIKYAPYSSSQASVANPDSLFTTLTFPISSAGSFSVSTTSPALTVGKYTMTTQIRNASLINSALNFLGFGQFATLGIRSTKSSTFTAAHLSGYDVFVASTTASIDDYLASSTVSLAACSSWTSFSLGDCLNLLFVPQTQPIYDALDNFKSGFLTYAPWGYLTRFVVIMSGSATSTLPSFTVDVPIGSNAHTATTTLSFDMQDMIVGGGTLLDSIKSRDGSGRNMRDVIEPWIQLFIALSVVLIIARDLMNIATHTRRNFGHNGRE